MSELQTWSVGIRPRSDVYSTYRRIDYKSWYAIGEFVDNATQNFFDHRTEIEEASGPGATLTIDIAYDPSADTLSVADNANGMNFEEFSRAVQLNEPPDDTSGRSEFGMGLKMAACWLGSRWRVVSSRLGSDIEYEVLIDVDDLERHSPDNVEVLGRVGGAALSDHYTRIEIEGLYRKFRGRGLSRIREHLASMYRRDLASGTVTIKWNGEPLGWDPDPVFEEPLADGETLVWEKPIELEISGLPVSGCIWIRMPGEARRAGLHLFRRGRLVEGGPGEGYKPYEIFGAPNSFQSQRLVGELDLDDWPVTQTKDAFDWVGDLEYEFISRIREQAAEFIEKVEHIRSERTTRPTRADAQLAGDAVKETLGGSGIDEAMLIVEQGPTPPEVPPSDEIDHVTAAAQEAGDPTYVNVGSDGLPTLTVYWLNEAPDSEIYAEFASPSDDELLLNVNLNHPYVVDVLQRDPEKLKLWTQMLFVDALVERGARRKGGNVPPRAYRVFKDQFLRKLRASQG